MASVKEKEAGTGGGTGNVIDIASYFKPISLADLPKQKRGHLKGRENKWGKVVKAFLDSGEQVVKLNLPPREGDPTDNANSVRGAIHSNLKKSGMPAIVVRRGDEVFLLRADLNGASAEGEEAGGLTE